MTSSLPPRNWAFVIINILAILAVVAFYWVGGFLFSFLGLFVLAAVQLISALSGALRGNRIKGYYFVASILFLVIYVGMINGLFSPLDFIYSLFNEFVLLILFPLGMAVIYVLILIFFTNEVARPNPKRSDQLLDDEVF